MMRKGASSNSFHFLSGGALETGPNAMESSLAHSRTERFASEGVSRHDPISLGPENSGFVLLRKLGWKGEGGLGKNEQGISKPVEVEVKNDRRGIGLHKSEPKKGERSGSDRKKRDGPIDEAMVRKSKERGEKVKKETRWRQKVLHYLNS